MGLETNSAEIVCSSSTGSVITSGGGFSNFYGMPSYQKQAVTNYFSTVSPAPVSGYNRTGRGIPDVSLAGSCYYVVVGGSYNWNLVRLPLLQRSQEWCRC